MAETLDLPQHVLRFWETEFKQIQPKRTGSGQRLYRPRDVEMILEIKKLLYEEKFTIEGARQQLKQRRGASGKTASGSALEEIRRELIALRDLLG